MVKDGEGNNIRYLTIMTDISKRIQLEKELKSLSKFPGEDPNPVLRVSREGRILYANDASSHLLNLWGCQVNQILPETWRKMVADALYVGTTITFDGRILSPRVFSYVCAH